MVPFPVLEMDGDLGGPLHFPFVVGDAEAPFRIHCFSHRVRKHRVHEFPDAGPVAGVNDHQPFAEADLGAASPQPLAAYMVSAISFSSRPSFYRIW